MAFVYISSSFGKVVHATWRQWEGRNSGRKCCKVDRNMSGPISIFISKIPAARPLFVALQLSAWDRISTLCLSCVSPDGGDYPSSDSAATTTVVRKSEDTGGGGMAVASSNLIKDPYASSSKRHHRTSGKAVGRWLTLAFSIICEEGRTLKTLAVRTTCMSKCWSNPPKYIGHWVSKKSIV